MIQAVFNGSRSGPRNRGAVPPLLVVGRPLPPSGYSRRIVRRSIKKYEIDDDEETESENDKDSDEDDYEDPPKVYNRARPSRKGNISPKRKQQSQQRTDKVLTFLQNARKRNIPVRAGKWNEEEDNYLRKLVRLFNQGVLDDIEEKTSMRSWLSKMLNCCPMRISKKQMHGEPFKGKAKYKRCRDRVERMSQEEYSKSYNEVHRLRVNFLKHWAKEEFGKWNKSDRAVGFEAWYSKVMTTVPEPKIAVNKRIKTLAVNPPSAVDLIEVNEKPLNKSTHAKRPNGAETTSPRSKLPRLETAPLSSRPDDITSSDCSSPLVLMKEDPTASIEFDLGFAMYEENDIELMQLVMAESTDPSDDLYCREVLTPEPMSPCDALILDFGPPSMWSCDPCKNTSFSNDFLFDDESILTDPSVLIPYDLPIESWSQSAHAAYMITPF